MSGRDALIEMREADEAIGVDPQAFVRPRVLGPPAAPAQEFVIPRPDWEQEDLERRRREAAALRPVVEPDPAIHAEDVERRPARAGWRREQLVADRGAAA